MGNAIIMAARQVKESLTEAAAELLGISPESLEFKDRKVFDRDNRATSARIQAGGSPVYGHRQEAYRARLVDATLPQLGP